MPAWAILAIAAAVLGILTYVILRVVLLPSAGDMGEVIEGLQRIQKQAFENVLREGGSGMAGRSRQYYLSRGGAGIYYTISAEGGRFCHHVSLKLRKYAWHRKRSIYYSLTILMELTHQFTRIFGDTGQPKLEITESELGTIHHMFTLSEPEQEVYRASLASAAA